MLYLHNYVLKLTATLHVDVCELTSVWCVWASKCLAVEGKDVGKPASVLKVAEDICFAIIYTGSERQNVNWVLVTL